MRKMRTYGLIKAKMRNIKEKLEQAEEIKVVGIIRPSEGTVATSMSGTIGYTTELKEYVINKINDSEIVKEQKENPDINVLFWKHLGVSLLSHLFLEKIKKGCTYYKK